MKEKKKKEIKEKDKYKLGEHMRDRSNLNLLYCTLATRFPLKTMLPFDAYVMHIVQSLSKLSPPPKNKKIKKKIKGTNMVHLLTLSYQFPTVWLKPIITNPGHLFPSLPAKDITPQGL